MKNVLFALVTLVISSAAFAEEATGTAHAVGANTGMLGIAAALAIGLAAFGGALGQARAAAASLEGTARNPQASGKLFVPMIIALALIESLVIYALIVALQIVGKI